MLVGSKSWPTVLWRVAAIVRMCIPWKLGSYGQTSGSVHIGEEYVWQALCPRSSEGEGAKSCEVWRCVGAASTPMDSLPAWSRNFGKHIYLVQKFWLGSPLEGQQHSPQMKKCPELRKSLVFATLHSFRYHWHYMVMEHLSWSMALYRFFLWDACWQRELRGTCSKASHSVSNWSRNVVFTASLFSHKRSVQKHHLPESPKLVNLLTEGFT